MRCRIAVLVTALLLSACGFHAPEAKRTPPPVAPEAPLSTISATLSVPADAIARLINRRTVAKIAELSDQAIDCKITQCRIDLVATRNGSAKVTASGGRLELMLPFAIDARVRAHAMFVNLGATGKGTGVAHASTQLRLANNWQVAAHTTGDVKLEESRIALGSLRLDLTSELNRNSARLSRPLFQALDRDIPRLVRLKPQMQGFWAQAFRPVRVARKPVAWLLLAPEHIRFAQPATGGDAVGIGLSIEGRARVVVAERPPVVTPTPLPDLLPLSERANSFRVFVPATLAYGDASALAMQGLEKRPIRLGGGMTLRFQRLTILPSGADVVVESRFCVKQGWWDIFGWFDACGVGYLRGIPQYDARNETIRIAALHYDVATASALLALARAFDNDALGKELAKRLVFPVGKDLARLRAGIRQALARPQGRDITISGEVDRFGPPSLTWDAHAFVALFSAEGKVRAILRPH
jgi:hypothetical protein